MKGSLISLLQSRMDKCTSEQFWAVGIITGLSVFLISESSIIQERLPNCSFIVILAQVFLSAYGIIIVVHRHVSFYRLERELSLLLETEKNAPEMLKQKHAWWEVHTLSGVVFYTVWILLTCVGVISCYIQKLEK